MRNIQIIETVTYKSKAGVSDAQFIAAAKGLDAYIDRCGGLISRSLFKSDDDVWHEHMIWETESAYTKANSGFMASQEGQAVIALLDPASLNMGHAQAAFARVCAPLIA